MTIDFDEISYDIYKPGTYLEVRPRYDGKGLTAWPTRVLIVAPRLATGTGVALTKYRITRPEDAVALCGAGSAGAAMVAAYKAANAISDVYLVPVADEAAAVAATGTITVAGTATAGGVLALYIDDNRVPVTISAGMTAAQVATAVAAAVTNYAYATLPVTAAAAAAVVTLTSRHKGEIGNSLLFAVNRRQGDGTPAGLTVTLAAMAGGATNPNIQTVFDAFPGEWFTDFVIPWTDATTVAAVAAEMAARYTAGGRRDAHAWFGARGTFAALTTLGGLTNSPYMTFIGANGSLSAPWRWAAAMAGVATFQLGNDPARQLRGLVLPGISAPPDASIFTDTEAELLLRGGISTFNALSDGTVSLDRVVTTYKTTSLGVADRRTYLDVMIPKTMSRIRYDWRIYMGLTYPRHKLADDGTRAAAASDAVATPGRLAGSWGARCVLYEERGWIEGASGSGGTTAMAVFERDGDDRNRVNSRQPVRIIGNLMVLAGRLEFLV